MLISILDSHNSFPQFDKARSYLNFKPNKISWKFCKATYYFPTIRTIFTPVPKVGCTHLLLALMRAEDPGLTDKISYHNTQDIHKESLYDNYKIKKTLPESMEIVSNKTLSFSVIRNPWTRMVSGYRDKLSAEQTPNPGKFGGPTRAKIIRATRGDTVNKESPNHPTFGEYVNWLILRNGKVNVHFAPQTTTLCMRGPGYKYIVPLEMSYEIG